MPEKYLPIGSVVLLKDASKSIMITGYCISDKADLSIVYDYAGCLFPEGFIMDNQVALFNHDQIEKIVYLGLVNEEEKIFVKELKDLMNNPKLTDEIKQIEKESINEFDI